MDISWYLENHLVLVWLGMHGLSCRKDYVMLNYVIKRDFRDNLDMPIWSKQMLIVEFVTEESLRLKHWQKHKVLNILVLGPSSGVYMRYT